MSIKITKQYMSIKITKQYLQKAKYHDLKGIFESIGIGYVWNKEKRIKKDDLIELALKALDEKAKLEKEGKIKARAEKLKEKAEERSNEESNELIEEKQVEEVINEKEIVFKAIEETNRKKQQAKKDEFAKKVQDYLNLNKTKEHIESRIKNTKINMIQATETNKPRLRSVLRLLEEVLKKTK